MKSIAQSKLTKRLLLLVVLSGVLAYLRQPDRAQAIVCPCQVSCEDGLFECDTACDGNQSCLDDCSEQYLACAKFCQEYYKNCL